MSSAKETGKFKVILLGLLVLGSVAIFMLGVMVGTSVRLPEGLGGGPSRPEAGSRPAAGEDDRTAVRQEVPLTPKRVEVKGEDLTFYDRLAQGKPDELAGPAPPAAKEAPTVVPMEPQKAAPIVSEPAAEPSPPLVEAAKPAEAAAVTAAAPEKAAAEKHKGGKYSIQVIATRDQSEAKLTAGKLVKAGFDAVVTPRPTSKGTLFAVRVGRAETEAEARKIQGDIRRKTKYKDAFLVKD